MPSRIQTVHNHSFNLFVTDYEDEAVAEAAIENMADALATMSAEDISSLHGALIRAYSETEKPLPGDQNWSDMQMEIEDEAMIKAENAHGKQPDNCLARLHPYNA